MTGGPLRTPLRHWPEALAAALVAALFARDLGRWPIWFDEGYTWFLLRYGPAEVVARTIDDVHPPLYYLVLDPWASVFGTSLTALRAFSAVCMFAGVLAIAHLARRTGLVRGRWELAAVILATGAGSMTIFYAQEARMYGLGVLLIALSTLALLRMAEVPSGTRALVYGLSIAACAYTHYFSVGFVVVHAWWWWRSTPAGHARRRFAAALAVATAAYLPWLPSLWEQLRQVGGSFWVDEVTWDRPIEVLYQVLSAETVLPDLLAMIAIVVAATALIALGLTDSTAEGRQHLLLLVLPLPLTVGLLSLLSLDVTGFSSVLIARYLALLAPLFYAGLAIAVLRRLRSAPRIGALMALVAVLLLVNGGRLALSEVPRASRPEVERATALVRREARGTDLVVVDRYFHYFSVAHHLEDDLAVRVLDRGQYFGGAASMLRDAGLTIPAGELTSLDAPIWLVGDQLSTPESRDLLDPVLGARPVLSRQEIGGLEVVQLGPSTGSGAGLDDRRGG